MKLIDEIRAVVREELKRVAKPEKVIVGWRVRDCDNDAITWWCGKDDFDWNEKPAPMPREDALQLLAVATAWADKKWNRRGGKKVAFRLIRVTRPARGSR